MRQSLWVVVTLSIFLTLGLAGGCWLSACVDVALRLSSLSLELSEGTLLVSIGRSPNDPSRPALEMTRAPGAHLDLRPTPVRWGQRQVRFLQGSSGKTMPGPTWICVSLWQPLVVSLFVSALVLGRAPAQSSTRRSSRVSRTGLTAIAIVLVLAGVAWNDGQPFTLSGYRYLWCHGGTLEVGEYPIPPRTSVVGQFDLLPKVLGPNALDLHAVTFPIWSAALAAVAIAGWMHGRAWPVRTKGACHQCGYAIAGLNSSCPECGAATSGRTV